jgi:hypothetical protein
MGEPVSTILVKIDMGSIALPEFQRGYVWNRDQVRGLISSLYRGYPVGSFLVWQTQAEGLSTRGDQPASLGVVNLLLDGQQRITSLYGVIKGQAPKFFEGDERTFTGLHFNLESEEFEFFAPIKMAQDPLWINVTDLMKAGPEGIGTIISPMYKDSAYSEKAPAYHGRLSRILAIQLKDIHVETIIGPDKSIDVVVDIFNLVNSGGTKLSKGDLALARISAGRPETREEMRSKLGELAKFGYRFDLDWLLRNTNAVITGEAKFKHLHELDSERVRSGLKRACLAIDLVLQKISSRLGLDHDQVLFGQGALPLLVHYVDRRGAKTLESDEWDRLLFWYIQAAVKGRYSGSTESFLDRDLSMVENLEGGIDRLIQELLTAYGDLHMIPEHFSGWSLGARFYPVLYMMTRMLGARDWGNGNELKKHLLGQNSSLEVHHVFPKRQLYDAPQKYTRSEVNAVGNFCFLTKETNLQISDKEPEKYFAKVAKKHPGALESQWIPMEERLWKIRNYREFLAARKELLAAAANRLLEELFHGPIPSGLEASPRPQGESVPGSVMDDEEAAKLDELNAWVVEKKLPRGEISFELVDDESGRVEAILDLAWPQGMQKGLSRPVALLLNESNELIGAMQKKSYIVFTSAEAFKSYVKKDVLAGME